MDPQPPPIHQQPFFQFANAPITTTAAAPVTVAPVAAASTHDLFQDPPVTAETHAANVVAPSVPPSLNHPPYTEMIYAAITALKEKDGSSKRAIAKYIERLYTGLPPSHSSLLTHHLNRLKNNGLLIMVKKSYKLHRSDNTVNDNSNGDPVANLVVESSNGGPKRGRGRPPKPKGVAVTEPVSQPTDAAAPDMVPIGLSSPTAVVKRRGRGRPPKKLKSVASNGIKKAPKRLPKSVIVPYATGPSTVADVVSPRPRGRPKKGVASALAAVASGPGLVQGKRPGRPPKPSVSGVVVISKKRPGRPRKNANVTWAATESSRLQAEAYEHLKSRFEYFQSRVKQAVGVLRPQLTNETPANVVVAIQELEGLASMDINAPLREQGQPSSAPPLQQQPQQQEEPTVEPLTQN